MATLKFLNGTYTLELPTFGSKNSELSLTPSSGGLEAASGPKLYSQFSSEIFHPQLAAANSPYCFGLSILDNNRHAYAKL